MAGAGDIGRDLAALLPSGAPKPARLSPTRPVAGVAALAGKQIIAGAGASTGALGGGQLVEADYRLRTYHPAITLTSADGLFSLQMQPVKSISLADMAGNPLTLGFAAPV